MARLLLGGGSATLFNQCLLWLLVHQFGFWYLGASIFGHSVSIAYNLSVQRLWAFNGIGGSVLEQFPKFVSVNPFGLMLNAAILYALVGGLRATAGDAFPRNSRPLLNAATTMKAA